MLRAGRRALGVFVAGVDHVNFAAAVLAVTLLAALAVVVFLEVVARAFAAPTEWSLELTTYALVWCGFAGSAYALKHGRHIRIDVLLTRLPPRAVWWLELFCDFAALIFCTIVAIYGAGFVRVSYVTDVVSVSPLRVPMFIPHLAVPVGTGLLGLQFLSRIFERLDLADRGE